MGRVAIFTDDPGWHGKRLREAFAKRGYEACFASLTRCRLNLETNTLPIVIPGFEQQLPDAVFVRGVPGGSLEQVVFYLDVLHALKVCGIPVYNDGHAIERSVDKAMTSFLLLQVGLSTPPTWVVNSRERARVIVETELHKGHQVISKPLFGSQGEGIQLLQNTADISRINGSKGIYYLQRFIHCGNQGSHDWRVFVINGRTVASMRRSGSSWLNNVAQGARCEPVSEDTDMQNLAQQAVKILHMDYAGVDIMRNDRGDYSVIEVNSIPAWKGLQSVCQLDIAELLVNDLCQRYQWPKQQRAVPCA